MYNKIGRPTDNPRCNQLRIRLNDEELKLLNHCCEKFKMNKTQVVVQGIKILAVNKRINI